jgi:hypothetical protein
MQIRVGATTGNLDIGGGGEEYRTSGEWVLPCHEREDCSPERIACCNNDEPG